MGFLFQCAFDDDNINGNFYDKLNETFFYDTTSMHPLSQESMTKWLKIQANKLGFSNHWKHAMMMEFNLKIYQYSSQRRLNKLYI